MDEMGKPIRPTGMVIAEEPVSNRWRDVKICKVANGFILHIGCQTFVAKDWYEAYTGLGEYFSDPIKAEKKYCQQ